MIAILALMTALAQSCEAPKAVGETTQVAWISTVQDRVGAKSELTVFRTADLRAFVQERGRDATKLLRALGLLRPKQEAKKAYKITLFDVKSAWLCRPVEDASGASGGVATCSEKAAKKGHGIYRKSWTDCGYLLDSATHKRSLDIFRIPWSDAVTWGFCVLPLNRFLEGA